MEKDTKTSKNGKSATKNKGAAKMEKNTPGESGSMLRDFFIDELKDIYWAEKHLTKVIPKMQKAATSGELANAFADHLSVTEEHVSRLEKVFDIMNKTAKAKKCEAMEGITKEGESIIEDTEKGTATRDVGLIMAAQKVEHYEIATYGSLIHLARTIGHEDVAAILEKTLTEEKEADELLSGIAENNVNAEANTEED